MGPLCDRRADGYQPLPDEDEALRESEKKQEEFEEQSEKLLMEVYNALYKVWRRMIMRMSSIVFLCVHALTYQSNCTCFTVPLAGSMGGLS
jgi:hypothetical protein